MRKGYRIPSLFKSSNKVATHFGNTSRHLCVFKTQELRCRTEVLDTGVRAANNHAKGISMDPLKDSRVLSVKASAQKLANKIGHRRFITPHQIKDFYQRRGTGEYVDYTYATGTTKKEAS